MKSLFRTFASLAGCLFVALAATSSFAANTLPVKPGVYVDMDRICSNASMASLQSINGKTLSYGHGYCTIVSIKQSGRNYVVESKCVNPDGTRETWSPVFTIDSPTHILLDDKAMRWCFPDMNTWMDTK